MLNTTVVETQKLFATFAQEEKLERMPVMFYSYYCYAMKKKIFSSFSKTLLILICLYKNKSLRYKYYKLCDVNQKMWEDYKVENIKQITLLTFANTTTYKCTKYVYTEFYSSHQDTKLQIIIRLAISIKNTHILLFVK